MDETAVFGIALGTASASIALNKVRERDGKIYPCCWLTQGSKTEILANHAGERTTPTLVSYRYGGAEVGHVTSRGALYIYIHQVVGHAAKQSLHRNAPNTASHMTQLIGKE